MHRRPNYQPVYVLIARSVVRDSKTLRSLRQSMQGYIIDTMGSAWCSAYCANISNPQNHYDGDQSILNNTSPRSLQ